MTRRKRITLLVIGAIALVMLLCGLWLWRSMRTSNPWGAQTIGDIATPIGYTRVEAPAGSYTAYLRALPLKPRGARVQLYTGGDARLQFLSTAAVSYTHLTLPTTSRV